MLDPVIVLLVKAFVLVKEKLRPTQNTCTQMFTAALLGTLQTGDPHVLPRAHG